MTFWLLAASLPLLFWDQGSQTAELKKAGVERVAAPAKVAAELRLAGVTVEVVDPAGVVKLPEPGVLFRRGDAAATQRPWVNAAGWEMLRHPEKRYFYDEVGEKGPLAVVEAFAFGGEAMVRTKPSDLTEMADLLRFLKQLGAGEAGGPVDFVLVDNGDESLPEVMNLMARRNLQFRVAGREAAKKEGGVKVVEIGSAKYPKESAADPYEFALKVRREIPEPERVLKVYGSELVVGRVTGGPAGLRVHLINYGRARIEGLRVRVKGKYKAGELKEPEAGAAGLQDFGNASGGTEFTVPSMRTYAVIDLTNK